MQSFMNTDQILAFLKANWFKVGIAIILIYAALRKDFSFKINLNTPVKIEQPNTPPPARQARKKKVQERYTDNIEEEKSLTPNITSKTNQFNFAPTISSEEEENPKMNAEKRLEMIEESKIIDFIERFNKVAKAEEKKFGIPSEIIMANGLLNSEAGQKSISLNGHNYFGLQCTDDWLGETGKKDGICYRYYKNAWTSFRDHSLFLTTGKMSPLKEIGPDNYKEWAQAMEQASVGLEPNWSEQLMNVIRIYHLDR